MIILKHSFLIDIKLFLLTLLKKNWLDKKGYYYHLSTLKEYQKINFNELIKNIHDELKKCVFIKNLKGDYTVFLSNYGAFGSFNKPNIVYANLQRKPEEISLTIIHEIIHLMLEKDDSFKRLNHEEKEKMVEKRFKELTQVND